MSDWPNNLLDRPATHISNGGQNSLLAEAMILTGGPASSAAAWPAANRAMYCAVDVQVPVTIKKMAWYNGATVNGNVDAGIYDLAGTRLVSSGSTAQAGASGLQVVDITDTLLVPGTYFLALASNSATATFFRFSQAHQLMRVCGCYEQATAFALPATATFAAFTSSSYFPIIVATGVSTIL